jgi:predicted component of type VI protein secretion system
MSDTKRVPELVLHIVESPDRRDNEIALSPPVEIGTDPELGLTLADDHVSGRHARVQLSGDAAVVEDLGSGGGTFVNERPIHGPRVILPGDHIRVGLTVLELRPAGEPAPVRAAPAVPHVPDDVLHHVPDHALVSPEPEPPPFRAEESPAAFVPPEVDEAIGMPGNRLLSAWRDTHVKQQTHIAAFGLLAVAGLAVGIWLGFH